MSNVIYTSLIMTLLGVLSSVIGSMLPVFVKIRSKAKIDFLYQVVSGIMVGIVCISMIPESIQISGMIITILGIILGTGFILIIDLSISKFNGNNKINKLIIIVFSMAFHNIIEGIAVGASIEYSFSFGITIFLAMFLHDIPEGMIVGVANLDNNKRKKDLLKNAIMVGLFSGIGIFIGAFLGSISDVYTGISLSVSAGAMLYVVTKTLVSNDEVEEKSHFISLAFILGILVSAMITKL